jgi:hypothetical protein
MTMQGGGEHTMAPEINLLKVRVLPHVFLEMATKKIGLGKDMPGSDDVLNG